jgi:precorrin-6B methylase 2
MSARHVIRSLGVSLSVLVLLAPSTTFAQSAQSETFQPTVGQPGKDVVWVPTPQELVEKMLDLAKVTKQDFLMDLGSGDGRTVIAAAKRGLRAQGVEYNPDMVALSQRNAKEAGVSDRAQFVKADLFETDFSKANVVTMFLLPSINLRLRPKILEMRAGTRIVSNTFTMDDWQADESSTVDGDCTSWCTAHLWIVPAKVEGTWQIAQGPLTLAQKYQMVSGTLGSTPITDGRLRGDELTFTVGSAKYTGRVNGNTISGSIGGGSGGKWTATRQ